MDRLRVTGRCTLGGEVRVTAVLLWNLITERMTDRGRMAMLTWSGGMLNRWSVLTILSFPPTNADEPTAIIGFTP